MSAVIGSALTIAFRCVFTRPVNVSVSGEGLSEQDQNEQKQSERRIELLANSLYELTSHVDLQVGQHCLRVNEITDKLETPGEIGSALVLVAGKMLVNANQRLQTDLEDAKKEIQRQREMMTSCMQESRMDALTAIPNRRAFDYEIVRVFADRRRNGTTFCLLILDIDHFKRINDQYGHMVGDQLLKSFSRCLTSTFRESDFVARFGGEEFIAILPKTPLEDACRAADRIRQVIASGRHRVGDLELQVTASIGVKEVEDHETDAELLQRADKSLYAAKNGGRNWVYYYQNGSCFRFEPVVTPPPSDGEVATEGEPQPAEGESEAWVAQTSDPEASPTEKAPETSYAEI